MNPEIPGSSGFRRVKLKSHISSLLFESRFHRLMLRNVAAVVAFHRVDDRMKGNPISCTRAEFREYCDFFARNFNVLPTSELVRRLRAGEDVSGCISITFDDGYLDNYDWAAPELELRKLPATFFIASRLIGSNTQPWWDQEFAARASWMSWDDVRDLHRRGFEIGAHTMNHVDLGATHGAEAEHEIVGSKADIENAINAPVTLFSFPYGGPQRITEANRGFIRDAGFSCCFACSGGVIRQDVDAYNIPRQPITPWHLSPAHLGFEILFRR